MNRLLIISAMIISSCSLGERKEEKLPARLSVECTKEAVSDDEIADTTVRKTVLKDSIEFSCEAIKNCCGWYDDLEIQNVKDTVRFIHTNAGGTHVACDCDCLFRISVKFERSFFENTKTKVLFWMDREIK